MKHFVIRAQVLLVSVLLFVIFALMLSLVSHNNYRWDLTRGKIYSLSSSTRELLKKLSPSQVNVLAFYPQDDPSRTNFETFLREAHMHHRNFQYQFFDPDRVPGLAKQHGITEFYTVVIQYEGRTERIVRPTEESFTNALLRLSSPRRFGVCFVTGHEEAELSGDARGGLARLKANLQNFNYTVHEIILLRDKIPVFCNIVVVAGPHQDFDPEEYQILDSAFKAGRGILFLIDPMDVGAGQAFRDFAKGYGIQLGQDVLVDKMSRLAGGDFLVPLVAQYVAEHPITEAFEKPTFFPVSRSVQPAMETPPGLDVVPLALTGQGSWSEANLAALEKGEAAFEPENFDLAGPISIAVAVEGVEMPAASGVTGNDGLPDFKGRLVMVGDSDFLTNAYLELSGNKDFILNIIQWLTKDERFVSIRGRTPEFRPLFLTSRQRLVLLLFSIAGLPLFFLILGTIIAIWRRGKSV